MKKQIPHATPGRPENVSHLDEKLTEITTSAADRLKKWSIPLIAIVSAVVLIALAAWIVSSIKEGRTEDVNRRLYELVQSPRAQEEDYTPPAGALEELLSDVRGSRGGRPVLKAVVDFYLAKADAAIAKRDDALKPPPATTDTTDEKTPPEPASPKTPNVAELSASIQAWQDKALQVVEAAAAGYRDDGDIQLWAIAVKAKVEGDRKQNWLPPGRKYLPLTPSKLAPAPASSPAPPSAPPPSAPAAPQGEIPPASSATTPPAAAPVAPAPEGSAPPGGSGEAQKSTP